MRRSARLPLIRYLGLFLAMLLAAPALAQHTPPKPDFGADLVERFLGSRNRVAWPAGPSRPGLAYLLAVPW
jgi:hypothetical protein